jgi:hypothetical protein
MIERRIQSSFISVNSDGGQIGRFGWINSNTMAGFNMATSKPLRWLGSLLWLKHWPILDCSDV